MTEEQRRWTLEDLWCEGCGWKTVADGPDLNDVTLDVVEAESRQVKLPENLAEGMGARAS